ncbi:4Fe-4S ferredoxin iron-sulfur binding domain protein [Desulfatibacillum aliphaticivorans]|uniref:4Fe-4S ferredoxin iron-sulfur binding domain protein n=1 Tax=Desulfatibacillum aliphaticivorans TaxID=218208 RepID=B8FCT9_DESAL|nr:4Fe-4S double cluster binding domain-containing protein [Desulfatibacillum aliphaticivorans]ACL06370.1 4Fe-4S ferredoxin iron-sulfur binding domain protein [Desulfatibacillum aliphaticivorans]
MSDGYTLRIKNTASQLGADLAGIADLAPFKDEKTYPASLLAPFTRALSMAVHIPSMVFETIHEKPSDLYNHVYKTANMLLDQIALKMAGALEQDGHRSLPIPASQIIDVKDYRGALSHKAIARMAGLGWQGKSLLLVTPKFGPRVRLVTVLTNAPLEPDGPVKNRCGKCTNCKDACPAGAIKGVQTEDRYLTRNHALDFQKCVDKTAEFARKDNIGARICGFCIKACPFGRKNPKNLPWLQ